jgi:hypothetical protein
MSKPKVSSNALSTGPTLPPASARWESRHVQWRAAAWKMPSPARFLQIAISQRAWKIQYGKMVIGYLRSTPPFERWTDIMLPSNFR